jgi:hypothetical protein
MSKSKRSKSVKSPHHLPVITWTPLLGYRDRLRWRKEVSLQGGKLLGVLWTSRKWPLATDRPLFLGIAFWERQLPTRTTLVYHAWKCDQGVLVRIRSQSLRITYMMYFSLWIMAMLFAIDASDNLLFSMGLSVLVSAWLAWRIYFTNKLGQWLKDGYGSRSTL